MGLSQILSVLRRKLSESGQDNKSVKALNVKRTHSWPHIGRPGKDRLVARRRWLHSLATVVVAALVVVVARVPQQPSVSGVSTPPVHLPVVVAGAQSASSKQPEFLHLVPVFYIGLNIKYREYTPNGNQDSRCIVKIWFTESWTAWNGTDPETDLHCSRSLREREWECREGWEECSLSSEEARRWRCYPLERIVFYSRPHRRISPQATMRSLWDSLWVLAQTPFLHLTHSLVYNAIER